MTWYKTGTVAVTAGSNAVIGTGTSFIANSRVGDGFRGPDGGWYEITNIASDTAMSIAPAYGDPSAYSIAPLQGYLKDSADALRAATMTIAGGVADMQEQVAAATEAADSAGQSKTQATEQAGIATAAAEASTDNKDAAQLAAQQSQASAQASGSAADRSETARDSIVQSEQAAADSAAAAAESAAHAEEVTLGKAASGDNNDITSLRALTADGFDRVRQGLAPLVGATTSVAGVKGLVPAPSIGDRLKVLSGAGTWVALPSPSFTALTGIPSDNTALALALDAKLNKSDAPLSKFYESAQSAWVANGVLEFTHALGAVPRLVCFEAISLVAKTNTPVGTRFDVVMASIGSTYFGAQVVTKTTTTIQIRFAGQLTRLNNSSSSDTFAPADAQVIVRVFA